MRFDVEIESEPIDNFTLPISTAADRLDKRLAESPDLFNCQAAGRQASRTLMVHGSVDADSAVTALRRFCGLVEEHFRGADLGPLRVRSLRSSPLSDEVMTEPVDVAPPAPAGGRGWPAMATNRATAAGPETAGDLARLWAEARAVARLLDDAGHHDYAQAVQRTLRAGPHADHALFHLRHEVNLLRMTEVPVLMGIDERLAGLSESSSRILGARTAS